MDGSTLSATDEGAGDTAGTERPAAEKPAPREVLTREQLISKVRAYHPRVKSELLGAAYDFAKKHHGEQKRDSGDAYYSHPVEVASLLADVKLDEITIVAGLLHDVVEDTEIDIGDVEVRFGADVAELVDGVTKLDKLEYSSKELAQAENFQKFILATTSDIRVLLVKLADRLHNMRTLHFRKKASSRERTARETMDIYGPLARRVGLYQIAAEMEDLAFQELNPEARRAILYRQEELALENADDLERIRGDLEQLMEVSGIPCRVKGRRKQPYSLWRKLEKKSISFRDVADLFAFRVIVENVDDCYRVLGEIHTLWACIPDRFRDYISVPKPNGYASLHTTVRASGNRRVELQIRTEEMDRTAEFGVAAHWGYKNRSYGFDIDSARAAGLDPSANLEAFAELLQDGGDPSEFMEHAKLEMYREHVFAFTPKGKLIILPAGAMPLDFAYAVHSAVGDTCVGAKINGEVKPLRRPLKNGDVVEVIRGKAPHAIHGWEALAITGRARSAMRKLVREKETTEFRRLGQGLINMALRRAGIDPVDVKMNHTARLAGFENMEDMAEALGRGRISSNDVILAAFPGYRPEREGDPSKVRMDSEHTPLMVSGADLSPGVTLHLGNCCCPLPGDRIMGVHEPGKGIVVHVASCPKLAEYDDKPELWVDLRWTELARTGAVAIGRIRINASNERGVLAKLCAAVAQASGNITSIHTVDRHEDFTEILMEIEVEDLKRLTQILAALRSIAVVDRAVRDQEGENDE
ncbi:RelA/SpoT family protein [Hyphomonas sp.]|uniref:RelA/SpoT family protein n=1 Tax=Hyphomonas sp. TaxID=87 RepID=UPI000C698797|nr:bifunctional (p)ppGpp synthetase/guanosine-3',5'-bis(diphosphate) 3'-pyrophosphohydrolase [Hyphomonadaceae bacterium]|tara:strand:- start:2101 stop:4365 length:2265 start_codon:yes stop_codon:yes gene_type:complete|eukprot:TRINITY_DN20670_c0_g1_i1.p1 TRINITY_DN20670_c0_g1~~TRINITY_DN20670_c0_g1_i1.p1  ORF type:complete len:755 (-),score=155.73 TRINITY_DN20670_c0_g1_i1:3642-5906(-)